MCAILRSRPPIRPCRQSRTERRRRRRRRRRASAPPRGRALPVMGQEPKAKAVPPAPTPVAYPNLGRIIAISSGKGGVGKSTVSVNLAVALAKQGLRVGLMDADVYGPNIPMMMGINSPPPVIGDRIQPLYAHGVKLMSLGFLIEREQPAIWRGPIVMKIVTQFLRDVNWGTLDYLLVDMPPGTGDAQLSLVQATHVHGAVIVTTPQPVSTGDALRGAKMFERVNVPVLGIVENMSYLLCAHCGKPTPLFGSGGGRALADELHVPLAWRDPARDRRARRRRQRQPDRARAPGLARGARTQLDRTRRSWKPPRPYRRERNGTASFSRSRYAAAGYEPGGRVADGPSRWPRDRDHRRVSRR